MNEVKKLLKDKAKAVSVGNYKEAALACNAIGSEYTTLEKYEEALQEHLEELNYYEIVGDQLGIAVAHRMIGECYTMLNSFKKALHHVRKFYDLSVNLKSTIEEQRALATLGRTYYLKYQHESITGNATSDKCSKTLDQAELAYYKALKLLHNLSSEIKPIELAEMKCRLLLNLGLVAETRGDHKGSSKYVKQALDIASENSLYEDIQRCGFTLGTLYQKFGKHNEAVEVLNTALLAAKKLHKKNLICEVQLVKSISLISLEKYEEATVCLKLAYKLHATDDEDHEKIVKHLKISIGINNCERKLKMCKSLTERKSVLEKIADALSSINCYESAIKKYLLCLECMEDDSLSQKAPIYYSLAQTYLDDGNVNKALEYFEKECDCHEGEPLEQVKTMWKIAEVLEEEKKLKESEQFYIKAVSLAEKFGDSKFIHNSLSKLISFYNSTNNVIQAQDIKKKLDTIKYECQSDEELENDQEIEELFSDIHLSELSDSDNNEEVITNTTRKRTKIVEKKVNEKGETPLHQACINGNLNMVKRLVESGHSVNVRDYAGWTPLHEASNYGFYDIVEYLLDNGAAINDPGGPNCKGVTALHDASSCGNLDVIQLLIARGASVIVKDEDGETPLQALLAWKKRTINELDDVTLRQCKAVEDELQSEMVELGVCINKNELSRDISMLDSPDLRSHSLRGGEKRNRSPDSDLSSESDSQDIVSIATPPYFNAKDDQDWDDADGAKEEYKSVMENLRRSAAAISPVKSQSQRPKVVKGPSLIAENEVVNEWLIKDTNEIPKTKRKRRRINKLNVRTSKCIDNYLVTPDPVDNDENERFSPLINENSNISITSVNSIDKNTEINLAQPSKSENVKENFYLRINIANKLILVPVPDDICTVSWLTEEAALRFQNLDGSKPHLILMKNGALLSPSDLVKNIFLNNEEVFTTVEMWEEPLLEDKYVQLCNKRNISVSSFIRKKFQSVNVSSELNFSNCNISDSNLSIIFCALANYKSLQHLNLSGIPLSDSIMQEIVSCLPSFSALVTLNLSCCCLTTESLQIITNYLNNQMSKSVILPALKNMDLSYNYFSACPNFAVFFKLNSLVSLNLCSCRLESTFLSNHMIEAIKGSKNLEDFNFSGNKLGINGLCELLQNLPKKSLKKLNLNHTVDKEVELGIKLQAFFVETLPNLTELSLQGCYLTNIDLEKIAECLSLCPQLQICNLSANPMLSNFGVHNFIQKAYQNDLNISYLNIAATCDWRDCDFCSLTDFFKFKTLKHLCIDCLSENLPAKLIQLWSDKWGEKAVYFTYTGFCELNVK